MRIFFFFLLIPFATFSQDLKLPEKNGKIEYSDVVSVDSLVLGDLFTRAKVFVAESFTSAKSVIEMEDLSSGLIYLKGNFSVTVKALGSVYKYGYVSFNMTIQCKDHKYRYSITNFVHSNPSDSKSTGGNLELEKPLCGTLFMSKKYWSEIKEQTDRSVNELIKKLNEVMSKSLKTDW